MESISEEKFKKQNEVSEQTQHSDLIQPSTDDISIELVDQSGTSVNPQVDTTDEIDQVASSNIPDMDKYGHLSSRTGETETDEANVVGNEGKRKELDVDSISDTDSVDADIIKMGQTGDEPKVSNILDGEQIKEIQLNEEKNAAVVEPGKISDIPGNKSGNTDKHVVPKQNIQSKCNGQDKSDVGGRSGYYVGDGKTSSDDNCSTDTGIAMDSNDSSKPGNSAQLDLDLSSPSKHSITSSVSTIPLSASEPKEILTHANMSELQNQVVSNNNPKTGERTWKYIYPEHLGSADANVPAESNEVVYLPMSKARKPRYRFINLTYSVSICLVLEARGCLIGISQCHE